MLISFEQFNILMNKQKILDKIIMQRIDKSDIPTMEIKRKFALLIEISEFANEIKWFKYWSKKSADWNKVKEELIDVIHFSLSIGQNYIDTNKISIETFYRQINVDNVKIDDQNIGETFFKLINLVSGSKNSIVDIWKYLNMFIEFCFDNENQLIKFYDQKNIINTKRQIVDNY